MNNYILTFDYELFGSGKGDVLEHLVKPTVEILIVLNRLNIKATFFVEQLEIDAIIALKESYSSSSREHKDAVAIEKQLFDIIEQGHDIQLHLHPQWYNAKYHNNSWQLNFDWWRFSALPYRSLADGTPGKYELIKQGKASLERRFKTVKPDYVCHSFRAGGYNIGADKSSIESLINNNMLLDSSVCSGYFSNSKLSQYDYTAVDSSLGFWRADENFLVACAENKNSRQCIQLPLVTVQSSFKEKLSLARMYATVKNRNYKSINYNGQALQREPIHKNQLTNTNFDICLSSKAQLKKLKERIAKTSTGHLSFPVTLIGHPKDYSWFSPMTSILKSLKKTDNFITLTDFVWECNK
jgi:hypothetical protein